MTEWQKEFFRENWTRSFWKKNYNHLALHFEGERDILCVGFDNEFANPNWKGWSPWGAKFSRDNDLSYLGFSSIVADWYLDGWITEQITELVNDGFFERFQRVVFVGHSMGGYAALLFSQFVKGSYVAAFSPQITLEAGRADFDERYTSADRMMWRGNKTDLSKRKHSAARHFVFYDPYQKEDALHASALEKSGVQLLKAYHGDHGSFTYLNRIGIADEIVKELFFGKLTPAKYYKLFRHRRVVPWFHKSLKSYFSQGGRAEMLERIDTAIDKLEPDFFENRYQPDAKNLL